MGTPGIPGPQAPSVIDDLRNAQPAAKALGNLVKETAKELGASSEQATHWGIRWGTAVLNVQSIFGNILATIIQLLAPLVLFFLETLTNLRKDTVDAQVALSEATLSEFLATDVKVSGWNAGKDHAATARAAGVIGTALYNQLQKEFGMPVTATPGPGEKAAKTFSGFAVNFAVQNAIISTLADALSLHELQEFRELGVGVARNLGIGRLQRMALGTLLDNVIRKPYTRELQAQLRPSRLSPVEYIHARNRGDITDPELKTALQEHGFRDQDIAAVINEYTDRLSVSELLTLVRYGKLTEDAALAQLQKQGLDPTTAAMRFGAAKLAILNEPIKAYAAVVSEKYRTKQMTEEKYMYLMAQLPWTDDEIHYTQVADGAYREYYQHMLTWTQVITAFEQGIVDVDYVEAWLTEKGYSPDDILNMELLLAVKFDAFAEAAAKKAKPPKPPPTPKPAPPA